MIPKKWARPLYLKFNIENAFAERYDCIASFLDAYRGIFQAVREAEKQAAHDAAIFGRPVERSGDDPPGTKAPEKALDIAPGDSEEDEEDRPVIVMEEARAEEQDTDSPKEVRSVRKLLLRAFKSLRFLGGDHWT
jgi:hypothetical protein